MHPMLTNLSLKDLNKRRFFTALSLAILVSCGPQPNGSNLDATESVDEVSQVENLLNRLTLDKIGSVVTESSPQNIHWHLGEEGIMLDQALSKFGQPKHTVLVAVIDTGFDINHPDLSGKIWRNPKPKANYASSNTADEHGWSYFPAAMSRQADQQNEQTMADNTYRVDSLEITRLYAKLPKGQLTPQQEEIKFAYDTYLAKAEKLKKALDSCPKDSSKPICSPDVFRFYRLFKLSLMPTTNHFRQVKLSFDAITWGSRDVKPLAKDEFHGTSMASLIAATRDNNLGIDGISATAQIMPLAAIPEGGDERDENVYHAIRYAVDHGARIISGSFGKEFSPNADRVLEAIQYAADHNVLVLTSAGNSSLNNDLVPSFPHRKRPFANWLRVGSYGQKGTLISRFSNFGDRSVDLLAPGEKIPSLTPFRHGMITLSNGTSQATAITAGAAAFLLGHNPQLTASDLKRILMASVTKIDAMAFMPMEDSYGIFTKPFDEMVGSSGHLNLLRAMEMAATKQKGRSK